MDKEKNPNKAEQQHKIVGQLVLSIDEAINLKTMKAVNQGVATNVLRTLHHARWWQVLDALLIRRAVITVIYVII